MFKTRSSTRTALYCSLILLFPVITGCTDYIDHAYERSELIYKQAINDSRSDKALEDLLQKVDIIHQAQDKDSTIHVVKASDLDVIYLDTSVDVAATYSKPPYHFKVYLTSESVDPVVFVATYLPWLTDQGKLAPEFVDVKPLTKHEAASAILVGDKNGVATDNLDKDRAQALKRLGVAMPSDGSTGSSSSTQ